MTEYQAHDPSFDYLQDVVLGAAADSNVDVNQDGENDSHKHISASFRLDVSHDQQYYMASTASSSNNGEEVPNVMDRENIHSDSQTNKNDSAELFYSAASAVSACLPGNISSRHNDTPTATDETGTDNLYGKADNQNHTKNTNMATPAASNITLHGNTFQSPAEGTTVTMNTEAKSFVNGLLSPFSPLLTKEPLSKEQKQEYLQYVSLQPCRKVSIVVRVLPVEEKEKTSNDDEDASIQHQRCVFPHFKDGHIDAGIENNTLVLDEESKVDESTVPSGTSSMKRTILPRDMVVVNPTAFGKYIPSHITMETAKLVAQVAHISSEDWARLYEFHHVMWPLDATESTANTLSNEFFTAQSSSPMSGGNNSVNASTFNTMDSLSRAVSQDALVEHQSSLLISLGQDTSCIGAGNQLSSVEGLWVKIMNQCQALVETKGVIRLSMVEVLEDKPDSFRDLLYHSYHYQKQQEEKKNDYGDTENRESEANEVDRDSKTTKLLITLRHPDMKGAILEGLTEVSIDSMPALLEALSRRKRRRHKSLNTANTAVIGILKYWDSAVSYELNKSPSSQITCVELSSSSCTVGSADTEDKVESIIHRKSTVSLGQALRQLLLQASIAQRGLTVGANSSKQSIVEPGSKLDSQSTALPSSQSAILLPAVSYRETTLTKVLQRSMESSKIVVVASISPLSKHYDQTITTLNYLRRLLVQPGNTLTSPFKTVMSTPLKVNSHARNEDQAHFLQENPNNISFTSSLSSHAAIQADTLINSAKKNNERLQEIARSKGMLKTLVADPRQRIAKLLKSSPTRKPRQAMFEFQSSYDKEDDITDDSGHYHPTNYMQDLTISMLPDQQESDQRETKINPVQKELDVGPESRGDENLVLAKLPRQTLANEEMRHLSQDFDYSGNRYNGTSQRIDDDKADEWASEQEIERALRREIDGVMNQLYPEENTDNSEAEEVAGKHGPFQAAQDADADSEYEPSLSDEQGENDYNKDLKEGCVRDDKNSIDADHSSGVINDHMNALKRSLMAQPTSSLNGEIDPDHLPQTRSYTEEATRFNEELEAVTFSPADDNKDVDEEESLGLEPLDENNPLKSVSNYDSTGDGTLVVETVVSDEPYFTNEEWQETSVEERPDYGQSKLYKLDDIAGFAEPKRERNKVDSSVGILDLDPGNTEDSGDDSEEQHTYYDLPEDPLPINESMISQASPPIISDSLKSHSAISLPSPNREGSAFSSFASPYAAARKANHSKELMILAKEREQLCAAVEGLKDNLRKASEEHDDHLQQYEEEMNQLYSKLDEALDDKRAMERVANEAMAAQTMQLEEMRSLSAEREELRLTVESLRDNLNQVAENHDKHLQQYEEEITILHNRVSSATRTQRVLEKIADDAVAAHKAQVEETKEIVTEREDLRAQLEILEAKMKSMSNDHDDHFQRYQKEIRQLHDKIEESFEQKRKLQQSADEARFAVESQVEQIRSLRLEKDGLLSTLNSLKGNVKKVSGEHNDHLHRFKEEIQQLHSKLDQALSEKLEVEKKADEVRFANDEFQRRIKMVEDEIAACRVTNNRLEGLRREDQETIRQLNISLQAKEREKLDLEHLQNELLRLNQHKDHLENLVAHQKTEYTENLKDREEKIVQCKNQNLTLEEELVVIRASFASLEKQNSDSAQHIKTLQENGLKLTRELNAKDDRIGQLQSSYNHLEALRKEDQDTIRKLKVEFRKIESEKLALDQLHHKLSRLKQDKDHLESLMKARKVEYDDSMNERANEVADYLNQIETLKKKVETAKSNEQKQRNEIIAQLRALRESETSLLEAVHKRDEVIEGLKLENTDFEAKLVAIKMERDAALGKVQNDSHAHKALIGELERSKDEVRRQKAALDRLNEELDSRQSQTLHAEEKIFHMETSLRKFREETKEKAATFAGRQKETISVLQKTRMENHTLAEKLRQKDSLIEKLRNERDVCFRSLQDGRRKISELSVKNNHVQYYDDLFETPPSKQEYGDLDSYFKTEMKRSALPEIYITDYTLGDRGMSSRAEEIAACVAMSAKNSLQESQDEASQLRSQVYRLEEERTAEVSALRAKIRNLERDLTRQQVETVSSKRGNRRYSSYPYTNPSE